MRHSLATGHVAQMRWATMTPIPSRGKKVSGAYSRHFPSAIHSALIHTSFLTSSSHSTDFAHLCRYDSLTEFLRFQTSYNVLRSEFEKTSRMGKVPVV